MSATFDYRNPLLFEDELTSSRACMPSRSAPNKYSFVFTRGDTAVEWAGDDTCATRTEDGSMCAVAVPAGV